MQLGETFILKPPHSDNLLRLRSYNSVNTLGATYWTDGAISAPHYPPFETLLLRSPNDEHVFWKEDATVVAKQIDQLIRNEPDEYDHLPFVIQPTETDYYYAMEHMVDQFDEQTKLDRIYFTRQQAIYRANEPLRLDRSKSLSYQARENVESFLEMHVESNPEQQLLRAECYRELGEFERAINQISEPLPKPYKNAQVIFQQLILTKNQLVERLSFNPYLPDNWMDFLEEAETEEGW